MKRDKRTLRPYRIRYAGHDKVIMGRWYRWLENAKDSMVVYCRKWMKTGQTIEIINVRNMKLIGSCTKLIDGMRILNERQMKLEAKRRRPVKLRLVA